MIRYAFVFKGPDGDRFTMDGECSEDTSEGAFRVIAAEAERLAYGPVTVVRTCFSVMPRVPA